MLCPTTTTVEVVGKNILFIKGEAMDIGVPTIDATATIILRLLEVCLGLRMCTSICAICERILLHCLLTSAPGHHASPQQIVGKAIVAMHDAMQDDVTLVLWLTPLIVVLLDLSYRQLHWIHKHAILLISQETGPRGVCEVFLGMGDVDDVTSQWASNFPTWTLDCECCAKRVVTFVVDGASYVGVRCLPAEQVVDGTPLSPMCWLSLAHDWCR